MEANNNERGKKGEDEEEEKKVKLSCSQRCATSCHNFSLFMYNPETKEIMGRSGMSWLKILCFYSVFYAVLAGFFALCMAVFIKSLDPYAPTMQKLYSLLKDNPGMNFQPVPDDTQTVFFFNYTDGSDANRNNKNFTYMSFLNANNYSLGNLTQMSSNMSLYLKSDCTTNNGANVNEACRFNLSSIDSSGGNCSEVDDYGMLVGKPCVILRINKVFRWDPTNVTFDPTRCYPAYEYANDPTCTKQIEFLKLPDTVRSVIQKNSVAVSCEGENDGDVDNINKVTFYPPGGFPTFYFPYYNQPSYTPPVVMAEFDVQPGVVLMIWCRFWTQDVIHDLNDLQGSIHLELMIDH